MDADEQVGVPLVRRFRPEREFVVADLPAAGENGFMPPLFQFVLGEPGDQIRQLGLRHAAGAGARLKSSAVSRIQYDSHG